MAELLRSTLARHGFIGVVVLAQAVLLGLAVVVTVIFLLIRQKWVAHSKRKQNQYNDKLIELLFGTGAPNQGAAEMPNIWFWQESVFRDVILNQIQVMDGVEREKLVKLYFRAGYFEADKQMLLSRAWWRRLRTVIRLDVLSAPECREPFLELLRDPHDLVVLSATRALSHLGHAGDEEKIFASLELIQLRRRDAMVEILHNIAGHWGAETISRYLEGGPDPELAIACIRVLGERRATEAMPVFMKMLKSRDALTSEMLTELLDAIRLIFDPESIELVRPLLRHDSEEVRAKCVAVLSEFGDPEAMTEIETMQGRDESVEVLRAIRYATRLRA